METSTINLVLMLSISLIANGFLSWLLLKDQDKLRQYRKNETRLSQQIQRRDFLIREYKGMVDELEEYES